MNMYVQNIVLPHKGTCLTPLRVLQISCKLPLGFMCRPPMGGYIIESPMEQFKQFLLRHYQHVRMSYLFL